MELPCQVRKKVTDTVYIADSGINDAQGQRELLKNLFEEKKELKNVRNFNSWFNREFEKTVVKDDSETTGYGNWLKQHDEEVPPEKMSMGQMQSVFAKKGANVQGFDCAQRC